MGAAGCAHARAPIRHDLSWWCFSLGFVGLLQSLLGATMSERKSKLRHETWGPAASASACWAHLAEERVMAEGLEGKQREGERF